MTITLTTSWKAIFGVLGIFILGFFGGVAVTSIIAHRMATRIIQHPLITVVDALEKRLTRNLALDPDQQEKIHKSFQEYISARQAIQQEVRPKVQEANQALLQEINSVLHPDQQEKLSESLEDIRTRIGRNVLETGPTAANGDSFSPKPPVNTGAGAQPPR